MGFTCGSGSSATPRRCSRRWRGSRCGTRRGRGHDLTDARVQRHRKPHRHAADQRERAVSGLMIRPPAREARRRRDDHTVACPRSRWPHPLPLPSSTCACSWANPPAAGTASPVPGAGLYGGRVGPALRDVRHGPMAIPYRVEWPVRVKLGVRRGGRDMARAVRESRSIAMSPIVSMPTTRPCSATGMRRMAFSRQRQVVPKTD